MEEKRFTRVFICIAIVCAVPGFAWAEWVDFIWGTNPPANWTLAPSNPTTQDVIHFSGPLYDVYSNTCVACLAAGCEPAIAGTFVMCGEPVPPDGYCFTLWDPVCGIEGEFGPLSAGQWEFYSMYPAAPYCFIEFTVREPLTILSPNGGEFWAVDSDQEVKWNLSGDSNSVMIEYSTNNGGSWETVEPDMPNSGSYVWTVPDVNSQQCLVKITDAEHPLVSRVSSDTFTIYPCQRVLPMDLNKDCYVDFEDFAVVCGDWLTCGNPYDPNCW